MSENETRDGATACELGVHIQVEKTENPGAAVSSCFGFSRLFYILPPSFSTGPSPWHPMGNSIVKESLGL